MWAPEFDLHRLDMSTSVPLGQVLMIPQAFAFFLGIPSTANSSKFKYQAAICMLRPIRMLGAGLREQADQAEIGG
jgi:hypothetical protein